MDNIKDLPSIKAISIKGAKIILNQMEKCICKIYIDTNKIAIGFFMKIPYESNKLPVLITNSSILNSKDSKNYIELALNDDNIYKKIELDSNRKIFKCLKYDLIMIEIYQLEDKIFNYLELDDLISIFNNEIDFYKNKSIYAFQYSIEDKNILTSYGILLLDINSNKINHNLYIKNNSYIYPILSLDNYKIIGFNNGNSNFIYNINFYIKDIIKVINDNKNEKNKLNELSIKYLVKDNEKKIKIFDKSFVINNEKNCKLIISENEIELSDYIDINKFNLKNNILEIKLKETKKITNMSNMFYGCKSLLSISDFDKWDISNINDISNMFYCCSSLKDFPDISKWDTSKIYNISNLFYQCSHIKYLPDISKWDTKSVKYMNNLFDGCVSLLSLPDISKWDTSNAVEMSSMFRNCRLLTYLPDISKWNTEKVVNLSFMFFGCKFLNYLPDISNWNTDNVINMMGMFANCYSLSSLPDISKWNTSKVWNMNGIFYQCTSLSYLPNIENWNIKKVIKNVAKFTESINIIKIPE